MQIAQKLYEGINLGSETTGLITYMRTDGVQMSFEAIGQIREAIARRSELILYLHNPACTQLKQRMRKKHTRRSGPHPYGDILMKFENG